MHTTIRLVALAVLIPAVAVDAQVVRVPQITITPVGPVQVPLMPGGRYNIQLPVPPRSPVLSVTTTVPGVTITQLPNGPGGEIRRQIDVLADAEPTRGELHIVTEGRDNSMPLIVVPPPPPPPPSPPDVEIDTPDVDTADTIRLTDEKPFFGRTGIVLVFIGGIAVGAFVRRRRVG